MLFRSDILHVFQRTRPGQWRGVPLLASVMLTIYEMDEFLQCDKDLIELQDKIEYYKTTIFTLEQILRSINSRTWDIKSAIEWHKFTNGMI